MTEPVTRSQRGLLEVLLVMAAIVCLIALLGGCQLRVLADDDLVVPKASADLIAQSAADAHAMCEASRQADAPAAALLLDGAQALQVGIAAALGYRIDPAAPPLRIPLAPKGTP